MSGIAELYGLLRSLLLYEAVPGRLARLARFYARFLGPGDLAIDGGAHLGTRTRAFLALGARVVAVEPHPLFARILRWRFREERRVFVLEAALAGGEGRLHLHRSATAPTVSTADPGFRDFMRRRGVRFGPGSEVPALGLDALLRRFGIPAFVKLDLEGMEAEVLEGLSQPLRALSFEHLPGREEATCRCLRHLARLGRYRYGFVIGERSRFALEDVAAAELTARLAELRRAGDVYAWRAPSAADGAGAGARAGRGGHRG